MFLTSTTPKIFPILNIPYLVVLCRMVHKHWLESRIQEYITTQALRAGLLFTASSPELFGSARVGSKAKLMGARKGWPDMEFVLLNRTVYIELKGAKTPVSKDQKEIHAWLKRLGHEVHVVRAPDGPNAWGQICDILDGYKVIL